jgi:hypothetical protein
VSRLDDPIDELIVDIAAPLDWRTVPAEDAEQAWHDLREWVDWFTDRYRLDHRVVPPCWYLHGALVDLLSALRDRHRMDFQAFAPPSGPCEWHALFQTLEPRLRDWAARTGCTRDAHRDDLPLRWPEDSDRWTAHLAADRAEREQRTNAQRNGA